MIVNLNGRFVAPGEARVPVDDGTVLFGDSLFETIKARRDTIFFLDEHLDRIELAARLLDFPFSRDPVRRALLETAARLESQASRLRLTVSRGSSSGLLFPSPPEGHFIISAAPYREPMEEERTGGIPCVFAPNRRVNPLSHLPQMKMGNYADCLYAANDALGRGAREALFRTDDDLVLEGATSNLFLLRGRTLVTPPAGELVLAGIMRRQVLSAAGRLGFATEVREVSCEELFTADEAFITNSLIELLPISSVEGKALSRGNATEELRQAVDSF
jgi:branched-subunit amino acid aminotransferase/4-amino-4-deoxychorismate lyase